MTTARELTTRLAELLRREHSAMADFLVALADFDRRRLWADLGHSSLFYFLHRELGLSAGAAHYRKVAAGLVQRFPEVEEPLRDGRLCITSVVELAKVLTPGNRVEVLPRFFHRSKREAMAVAAELRPADAPPRREMVTPVRPAPASPSPTASVEPARTLQPVEAVHANFSRNGQVAPPGLAASARRDTAEPLTGELSRFHVTVSRRFLKKLDAARAALSHVRPGASAEEILEAGLDLVLTEHAKRKGLVKKPRREPPPSKPGHVPANVRREVWTRDGGRCQWPLDAGGICGSTIRVELDHVMLRCRGGPPTVGNLRCLCKVHNDRAAREALGDDWMDRFTRGGRVREPVAGYGSEQRLGQAWVCPGSPVRTGATLRPDPTGPSLDSPAPFPLDSGRFWQPCQRVARPHERPR